MKFSIKDYCAWGWKDWVERTETKTRNEKDLELASSCAFSRGNWSHRSDIEKIGRLSEEVRCKE